MPYLPISLHGNYDKYQMPYDTKGPKERLQRRKMEKEKYHASLPEDIHCYRRSRTNQWYFSGKFLRNADIVMFKHFYYKYLDRIIPGYCCKHS